MTLRSNYLEINEKEEENGADSFNSMRQPISNHQGLQWFKAALWCSDADVLSMRSGLAMTFTKKLMTWKDENGYVLERFLRPLPAGEDSTRQSFRKTVKF